VGLLRKSPCIEDRRKESVDSRQNVSFTLNASITFSGCVTAQDYSAVTKCRFVTSIPLPVRHSAVTSLLCINVTKILQTTFSGVSGGLLRKSPKKDERKESVDSRQNAYITLNASTTFSGVSGGFYA